MSYTTLGLARGFYNFRRRPALRPILVGSLSGYDICIMHQTSWVHRHLQACNFVFDPGWRRLSRQWCIHQLFAGHFQDDGAYHKWRVNLRTRRRLARPRLAGLPKVRHRLRVRAMVRVDGRYVVVQERLARGLALAKKFGLEGSTLSDRATRVPLE